VDEPAAENVPVMSASTAEAVIERAAHVTAAGMPLAAGLRAAAQETDSWRLARALRSIATHLDRGRSLEDCLTSSPRLPPHLAGLIRAARRTSDFSPMLAQWIENRRAARQHWRGVVAALAYPLFAVALACLVFLLFALLVVPPFRSMFEDFGLRLPSNTVAVLWICDAGSRLLISFALVAGIALVALRLIGGSAGWSTLMTSLPLIGPPWHWTGVAEMLRCLSLLVEQHVPLPEALRLTADGITDGYVGSQCRRLALLVEKGTSLTMSLIELRTLPVSIAPLIHWGEQHGLLADGLRSAAEMIEGRLNLRSDMLVQVVPPVTLILVGWMAISMMLALFLPLISLIQGLT